jgi:hypothetical protein
MKHCRSSFGSGRRTRAARKLRRFRACVSALLADEGGRYGNPWRLKLQFFSVSTATPRAVPLMRGRRARLALRHDSGPIGLHVDSIALTGSTIQPDHVPLPFRPREAALLPFCREQPAECLFPVADYSILSSSGSHTSSAHRFSSLSGVAARAASLFFTRHLHHSCLREQSFRKALGTTVSHQPQGTALF